MPPQIGFLAGHGVAPGLLLQALAASRELAADPADLMIAEGWLSADFYYSCLARHCRASFVEGGAVFAAGSRHPVAVQAGLAQLAPGQGEGWLAAPRGAAIARLIADAQRRRGAPAGFAVTTPLRFSLMAQAQSRGEMVAQASLALPQADPALSARRPPGSSLAAHLAAPLCVAAVLISPIGWLFASLLFVAALTVRLAAAVAPTARPPPPPLRDAELPTYSVLVPLHREAKVVEQLVEALGRLDYPRSRLEVILIVEEHDRCTRAALAALRLPPHMQVLVAPDGKPRTKPRALNMALPLARGRLLVVYDAEDRPDPRQLRLAAASFAEAPAHVACLQARLAIENASDSWLTQLFALEYDALFGITDPGLAALGLPVPLGGTSNHFRTGVLRQCGGWDAWNVTEDADLGLRLARAGFAVGVFDSETLEEAPAGLRAWLGQRRRWQKGWVQTLIVHARQPRRLLRELGPIRALAALGLVGGMVAGPLFGPFFMGWMAWRTLYGPLLSPASLGEVIVSTLAVFVFLAGIVCALLAPCRVIARDGQWRRLAWLALTPAYLMLISLAAWQGLAELYMRPFHWQKTAHGLAKKRRP